MARLLSATVYAYSSCACFSAGMEIDLEKAGSLVVWKVREAQQMGAVTASPTHVIYSVTDGEQLRQFLASEEGKKRFPSQDRLDKLLLRSKLRCRDAATGQLLWNAAMGSGGQRTEYPIGLPPMSAPTISQGRVFVQTAEAQVIALDVAGLADGKNNGPFRWEQSQGPGSADILWWRDFKSDLKVVPRNVGDIGALIAQPLVVGERVYCTTGNAGAWRHPDQPTPNLSAPAFVALSARDGSVLWQNNDPSAHVDYFQNAPPFLISADADPQVIGFPGGDGHLYLLDAKTGATRARLPCFSKEATPWTKERQGTRNFFSIAPAVAGIYILTCPGWTIEMLGAERASRTTPVFAYKMDGDSAATLAWTFDDPEFLGTLSPILIHKNEVFVLGFPDRLIVLDLATGKKLREGKLPQRCLGHAGITPWKDRLIVCLEDGIYVLANNANLTPLSYLDAGEASSIFSQPVVREDRLTVSTSSSIWVLDLNVLDALLR